jgi:serine/threonine protein kinase
MRYLHSCGVIHCDPTPDKVLLDWDRNVRIADFGLSISPEIAAILLNGDKSTQFPSAGLRFVAPECFDAGACLKSGVFSLIDSFKMISLPSCL